MGNIFSSFENFKTYLYKQVKVFTQNSKIIANNKKRGKYLAMLYEATSDNYFIIKCLLKSNIARVILLTQFNTNVLQTNRGKNCKNQPYIVIYQKLSISIFQFKYFVYFVHCLDIF